MAPYSSINCITRYFGAFFYKYLIHTQLFIKIGVSFSL